MDVFLKVALNAFDAGNVKYLRFNIMREAEAMNDENKIYSWIKMEPIKARLVFAHFNSQNMGILKYKYINDVKNQKKKIAVLVKKLYGTL